MRALLERGWRVSEGQRRALAEIRERHDLTGAAYAAGIIRQTPPGQDALGAVLRADAEWQRARTQEIEEREKRDANPPAAPRENAPRYPAGAPERIRAALPLPAREIAPPVAREPSPAPETDAETRKRRREMAEKLRAAGLPQELLEPYLRDAPPEA